jgi:uncharacterized FlaG/YvyC family protein
MNIEPLQAVVTLGPGLGPAEVSRKQPAKPSPAPTPEAASVAAEALKNLPQARQLEVNASFGQANRIIYRILDKETGDLIQQIPPEQLLEMARSIQDLLQAEQSRHLDVRS